MYLFNPLTDPVIGKTWGNHHVFSVHLFIDLMAVKLTAPGIPARFDLSEMRLKCDQTIDFTCWDLEECTTTVWTRNVKLKYALGMLELSIAISMLNALKMNEWATNRRCNDLTISGILLLC